MSKQFATRMRADPLHATEIPNAYEDDDDAIEKMRVEIQTLKSECWAMLNDWAHRDTRTCESLSKACTHGVQELGGRMYGLQSDRHPAGGWHSLCISKAISMDWQPIGEVEQTLRAALKRHKPLKDEKCFRASAWMRRNHGMDGRGLKWGWKPFGTSGRLQLW